MNAKELLEISKTKAWSFDEVIKQCETQAKIGETNIRITSQLVASDVEPELFRRGFTLSKFTDPFGMNVLKISWGSAF